MSKNSRKTNTSSEKTKAPIVVDDTASVLISDEEAAQAVGGSGASVIKIRLDKSTSKKTHTM